MLIAYFFFIYLILLLCVHKEVARNAPALHAGPHAFCLAAKSLAKKALPYGRFAVCAPLSLAIEWFKGNLAISKTASEHCVFPYFLSTLRFSLAKV